jgi:hypothetical protein
MQIPFHNPNNLALIDYRKLEGIQGNLKYLPIENREKLLNSLQKFGFFEPFQVWKDQDTYKLVDGHARLKFFLEYQVTNQNNGYEFPYLIVEAKNLQEAKEKLAVISSQYHTITPHGWEEFSQDMDKDFLANSVHFDLLAKELAEFAKQQEYVPTKADDLPIIPIDKDDNSSKGTSVPIMKFGKTTINITEEELDLLNQKFTEYTQETKVPYGFVHFLINPND